MSQRRLSEEELRVISAELSLLRSQAKQVAKATGLKYWEALLLLTLREAVIASNTCRQTTMQPKPTDQGG